MAKVRFLGVAAVLVAMTIGALVLLAPTTHGQQASAGSDDRAIERRLVRVVRGGSEIGVSVRDVDEADAKREATATVAGAVIEEVRSGSPGEKAGYKAGDIVTGFDGERVRSARQFARLVDETPAGRRVKSTVLRDGKQVDLEVAPEASSATRSGEPRAYSFRVEPNGPELSREIERAERAARRSLEGSNRMPPSFKVMPDGPGAFDFQAFMRPSRLGVGVLDLSPELAAHFGAKNGVVVNTVTPDSPAARAGIKVGDVITSVDGAQVDDSGDLRRRVWKDEDATSLSLGVVRDKRELTVKVPLDAPKRETATRIRERV